MTIFRNPNGADPGRHGGAPLIQLALASLALSMLMPSLDTSIANVGLPTLARTFAASFQQVQWVILAYLLAITTFVVGAGRLGDLFGRRRLLEAGIGVFTGASLLCGLAPTFWLLIVARGIQGLGAATMVACTLALVGETVPKARLGSAMGLLGTMSALGTMLGPSLGGILIAGYGWRVIFLINVPLGILNLGLARRHLPADLPDRSGAKPFDAIGTFLLALTLAAYALAMTLGSQAGPIRLGLMAAACLGGLLFVRFEMATASPLVQVVRFRAPAVRAGLPMNTLVATVMMSTLVVGPFYLSLALGLDPARVGLVMAVGPLISILCGFLAGRVVDHLGAPAMVLVALLGMAAGALAMSALPARFGVPGYLAAILILTPGYQLFQAANNTAVMLDAHPDQRGVMSSLLSLSRNLGLITGAAVMGAVFMLGSGANDLAAARPEAISAGFRITFEAAAALTLLAAAIAAKGGATKRLAPFRG